MDIGFTRKIIPINEIQPHVATFSNNNHFWQKMHLVDWFNRAVISLAQSGYLQPFLFYHWETQQLFSGIAWLGHI